MKASKYNFVWELDGEDDVLLYNSLSGASVKVAKPLAVRLQQGEVDDALLFLDGVTNGGFVIGDEVDERETIRGRQRFRRNLQNAMLLTIAPTLHCNFACEYCFEQAVQPGRPDTMRLEPSQRAIMSPPVQKALVDFVGQHDKLRGLRVIWFGGEPLLARRVIYDLSEHLTALADARGMRYYAYMVTNGYLLDVEPDVIERLRTARVRGIKVTLDGPPDLHDKRRCLKTGRGTFQRIVANLHRLQDANFNVDLRVNVDEDNREAVFELADYLAAQGLTRMRLTLARVVADAKGCSSIEDGCTASGEFMELEKRFRQYMRDRGYQPPCGEPFPSTGGTAGCCATMANGWVIDPDGDMYKCWNEIGHKPDAVGNLLVASNALNQHARAAGYLEYDPFAFDKCHDCPVLPLCMGGCAYGPLFLEREPECPPWKSSLRERIVEAYGGSGKTAMAVSACKS